MTDTTLSTDSQMENNLPPNKRLCTVHVCISCRESGMPRHPKEKRPGFILFNQLSEALGTDRFRHQVEVKPAECLSLCPRPCGIAISTHGAWTYLFGDQNVTDAVDDIAECIALYLKSSDGFMARGDRPNSLRGSILGRVPPQSGGQSCT